MTEEEWYLSDDLNHLINVSGSNPSRRKFRLFAVACFRRILHLTQPQSFSTIQHAVDLSERFADGLATDFERIDFLQFVRNERDLADGSLFDLNWNHYEIVLYALNENPVLVGKITLVAVRGLIATQAASELTCLTSDLRNDALAAVTSNEMRSQIHLFRDIFQSPFRPITLNPSWLTSPVVSLANQMYESRDFSPMPILADALQDAGCDSADVLNHCRVDSVHVRGCWVVDLILGKS